jgi:hypothetical protein
LNGLLTEVTSSPHKFQKSTEFWARLQSSIIILDAESEKPKIRKKSRRESEEEDVVQDVSAARQAADSAADLAAPSGAAFQDDPADLAAPSGAAFQDDLDVFFR